MKSRSLIGIGIISIVTGIMLSGCSKYTKSELTEIPLEENTPQQEQPQQEQPQNNSRSDLKNNDPEIARDIQLHQNALNKLIEENTATEKSSQEPSSKTISTELSSQLEMRSAVNAKVFIGLICDNKDTLKTEQQNESDKFVVNGYISSIYPLEIQQELDKLIQDNNLTINDFIIHSTQQTQTKGNEYRYNINYSIGNIGKQLHTYTTFNNNGEAVSFGVTVI